MSIIIIILVLSKEFSTIMTCTIYYYTGSEQGVQYNILMVIVLTCTIYYYTGSEQGVQYNNILTGNCT